MNVLSAFVEEARQGYIKTNRPNVIVHTPDHVRHIFCYPSTHPSHLFRLIHIVIPGLNALTFRYSTTLIIPSGGPTPKSSLADP